MILPWHSNCEISIENNNKSKKFSYKNRYFWVVQNLPNSSYQKHQRQYKVHDSNEYKKIKLLKHDRE